LGSARLIIIDKQLAEATAARAPQRQVAAMAASIRKERERVRHRAEAMRRQLHVLRPVAPPLNRRTTPTAPAGERAPSGTHAVPLLIVQR